MNNGKYQIKNQSINKLIIKMLYFRNLSKKTHSSVKNRNLLFTYQVHKFVKYYFNALFI